MTKNHQFLYVKELCFSLFSARYILDVLLSVIRLNVVQQIANSSIRQQTQEM